MSLILNILIIFVLAFAIGMFVAAIIWLLYNTMSGETLKRFKRREQYHEMKQLKHKNNSK